MEKIKETLAKANRLFNTVDHLAYVTYPLINDTKLIINITENLYNSLVMFVDALIEYERMYKRIPPLAENFESRFDTFKNKCAPRYNIKREHIVLINDLKKLVALRKKSSMEFVRKDKFVICNEDYKTYSLSIDKVKQYIKDSKEFVERINKVVK